jgi:outer membrane murein-binding lipoprotein Lpp
MLTDRDKMVVACQAIDFMCPEIDNLLEENKKLKEENKALKEQLAPINELLEESSAEDTKELAKDVSWLWEKNIDPEDYEDFVSLAEERGGMNADDLRSEIDEFEGDVKELNKEIEKLKKKLDLAKEVLELQRKETSNFTAELKKKSEEQFQFYEDCSSKLKEELTTTTIALDIVRDENEVNKKNGYKYREQIRELKEEVITERKKVVEVEEDKMLVCEMWRAEAEYLQHDSAKAYPEQFNDYLKEEFDEEMYKKMYEAFELAELLEESDEEA